MIELKHALDAKGHGALKNAHRNWEDYHSALVDHVVSIAVPARVWETYIPHANGAGDGESFSRVESFAEISRGKRGERKGKKDTHILALGLSSRKNLCVNPKVAEEDRESVDARCRT